MLGFLQKTLSLALTIALASVTLWAPLKADAATIYTWDVYTSKTVPLYGEKLVAQHVVSGANKGPYMGVVSYSLDAFTKQYNMSGATLTHYNNMQEPSNEYVNIYGYARDMPGVSLSVPD